MGRMMGIEPTYTGTTIRGLDRLATPAIESLCIIAWILISMMRIILTETGRMLKCFFKLSQCVFLNANANGMITVLPR